MSYVDASVPNSRREPVFYAGLAGQQSNGQQSNDLTSQTHDEASTHTTAGQGLKIVQDFLPEDILQTGCPYLATGIWENSGSRYLLQDPSFLRGCQPLWMDQLCGSALGSPSKTCLSSPAIAGCGLIGTWNPSQGQMPMGPNNLQMFWPDVAEHSNNNFYTRGPPFELLPIHDGATYARDTASSATVPPASLEYGQTGELDVPNEDYWSLQHAGVSTQLATIPEHSASTPETTSSSPRAGFHATTPDSQPNSSPASSAAPSPKLDRPKPPTTHRRQHNRAAASRCRARTTQKESDLEVAERTARARNEDLRGYAAKLRKDVLRLRKELLEQASVPDCKCVLLRRYLKNRAWVLCIDDNEDCGHGEEEHFMAVEDSDGDIAVHSPDSDMHSMNWLGEAQEEEGKKQQKNRKTHAGKRMAEENIADKGAWGTDKIPLVVDFSMAPTKKPPEESVDVKTLSAVPRRTSVRHGTKRKSVDMYNAVDLTA